MGTFYPNSSAQDVLSTPYNQDQKFTSYTESPIIHGNMMMYLNGASSSGSYSEIAPGTSMSVHNFVDTPSMAGRNEVMFIPPPGAPMSIQTISGQLNTTTSNTVTHPLPEELQLASTSQLSMVDGERNLHGLSLSLSTELSNAVPPPSFQQFSSAGLSPVLSSHLPLSGEDVSRPMTDKVDEAFESKDLISSAYGPYDLHGDGLNSIRFGTPNNLQYLLNPKAVGYNAYQVEQAGTASTILKSKYLKPAQKLLDEVVNVRDALKQHESGKDQKMNKVEDGPTELKEKSASASDVNESETAPSQELSATERQDLQNKLDKLLAMLDEVDRRYKQYYHQMQIMISSFDLVSGCGAAKPYTTLALKTISRHFRSLRDAISAQIQSTRKSLGEQDSSQGVIPRLRYVDQQLRQQRALQQFGMMRHAWRPQRGLPENAVTNLRAWLFEHFLHPYPKDSEKIMLARQTGLTRSQVANWFINARVRLWKPMIEDMYKEEFGDADLNLKSSPEDASKAAGEKSWTSEDRREELQESIRSMADSGHLGSSHDESETNVNHLISEMNQSTGRAGMMMSPHGGDDKHGGLMKLHNDHQSLNSHGFYSHDQNGLMAFQVAELGSYGVDNRVSLALGLRHIDAGVGPLSAGTTLRPGTSAENTTGSGTVEYSYYDSMNQQHKFGNSHLLNDFVV